MTRARFGSMTSTDRENDTRRHPCQLRRARLLAARTRDYGSITRRGVLAGELDRGVVLRAKMDTGQHDTPTQENDDERI